MADTVSKAERSRIMSLVKSKDTTPELIVRRLVHSLGYRYRLHVKSLPGTPDLVFPSLRKVILVHGCFWHLHACPRGRRIPKTRRPYWLTKLHRNRLRDRAAHRALRRLGYQVLTLWECQTRHPTTLAARLTRFLSTP